MVKLLVIILPLFAQKPQVTFFPKPSSAGFLSAHHGCTDLRQIRHLCFPSYNKLQIWHTGFSVILKKKLYYIYYICIFIFFDQEDELNPVRAYLLHSSLPNKKGKKCHAYHNATLYIACQRRLKFKFFSVNLGLQ